MIDPLAEVVTLLQPGARFSKLVLGTTPWRIRRSDSGQPLYYVILEGACRLEIDGHEPIELVSGDFVLIPAAYSVAMSSLVPPPPGVETIAPVALGDNEFGIGDPDGPVDLRMMVGHCSFGSPDASLLVSLLPQIVHVRSVERLAILVQLVRDESRALRPAREVVGRAVTIAGGAAHRGAAVHGGNNRVTGASSRVVRCSPRGRDPHDARTPYARVDGC